MSAKPRLSPKQRAFVSEYIVDRNATAAAKRAGYSPKTAKEQGYRLLTNVHVQEAIEAGIQAQEKRTGITADRVLQELGRVAFFNLAQCYDEKGLLIRPDKLPEDVARAIAQIETDEIFVGTGDDRTLEGLSKKLKPCDKVKALELLGKHFKLFVEKVEVDFGESLGAELKAARERVKGARA